MLEVIWTVSTLACTALICGCASLGEAAVIPQSIKCDTTYTNDDTSMGKDVKVGSLMLAPSSKNPVAVIQKRFSIPHNHGFVWLTLVTKDPKTFDVKASLSNKDDISIATGTVSESFAALQSGEFSLRVDGSSGGTQDEVNIVCRGYFPQ